MKEVSHIRIYFQQAGGGKLSGSTEGGGDGQVLEGDGDEGEKVEGAGLGRDAGAHVQMEVSVDDSLSVRDAGRIALRVRRIVESVPGVSQADIHLEVDDLEACRFLLEHEAMGIESGG